MTSEPTDKIPTRLLYCCEKISFNYFTSVAGRKESDHPLIVKNIIQSLQVRLIHALYPIKPFYPLHQTDQSIDIFSSYPGILFLAVRYFPFNARAFTIIIHLGQSARARIVFAIQLLLRFL